MDICSTSGRMDINGSPFSLKAYDSNRLIVSDIPRIVTYNHPVEFTVDASKSGEGQLEVAINDGLVPNQVKPLGNSRFLFTFIPKTNDPHIVSIKFNGHQIPGKHFFSSSNQNQILINIQFRFSKRMSNIFHRRYYNTWPWS